MQIKIADTQFAHGTSLGSGDLKIYPKHFEWYRGQDNINDIIVITESMFHKFDEFTEKIKIAWLIEPMSINGESYKTIIQKWWKFDYILTHNLEFINLLNKLKTEFEGSYRCDTKFCWYPFGGCWIMPEDRKIYPKTKGISIIASGKTETEGHRLRHEVIKALGDKVDVYGRGYNPVEYKLDALKDYQYSIVIENERTEGFFTEKIIDCFVTGTIPIYWGDPGIIKRLSKGLNFTINNGFVTTFNSLEDERYGLNNIINIICENKVWENEKKFNRPEQVFFQQAEQYTCPEDWLYNNFFMKEEVLKNQLIKFNIL